MEAAAGSVVDADDQRIWLRCVDLHAVFGTGLLAIRFFLQRFPPASGRMGAYTHIVVVVRGP
jgi:hypothetical protein